MSFIDATDH